MKYLQVHREDSFSWRGQYPHESSCRAHRECRHQSSFSFCRVLTLYNTGEIVHQRTRRRWLCHTVAPLIDIISFIVPFGLLVWSTGLAPNPLIKAITGAKKDPKTSRYISSCLDAKIPNLMIISLIVNDQLNIVMEDGIVNHDVWALGDAAVIEETRLPATAQGSWHVILSSNCAYLPVVANQQAKYLAEKMNRLVKDKEHTKSFEFHNAGSLAYIGDWYA